MGALTHLAHKDRKSAVIIFLLVNSALLGVLIFGKESTLPSSPTSAWGSPHDNNKEHVSQRPPSVDIGSETIGFSPELFEDNIGPASSPEDIVGPPSSETEGLGPTSSSEDIVTPPSSDAVAPPSSEDIVGLPSSDTEGPGPTSSSEDIVTPPSLFEDTVVPPSASEDLIRSPSSSSLEMTEMAEPTGDEKSSEEKPSPILKKTAKKPSKEKPKPPSRLPTKSSKRKYITYLPHSGFHNQRIALENALILAHLTKRTLVVPPCYLGRATAWMPFDELYANLVEKDKSDLEFCAKPSSPLREIEERCEHYMDYTAVSWEYLFNFDLITPFVDLIHREDIKDGWMEENLKITGADIYYVKDRGKYQYRIYDSLDSIIKLGKYAERINVADLKCATKKVIYFGSMFSSTRLVLRTKEARDFRKLVGNVLVYSNPKLIEAAELCADKLGGAGTYIGMHLRIGDGKFLTSKKQSVYDAVEALNKELMRKRGAVGNKARNTIGNPRGRRPSLAECIRLRDSSASHSPLLFLATDSPDPASDNSFAPLYARWPCIFTLNDLKSTFMPIISKEINDRDHVPLAKFLIPMLDGVLAARSSFFIGTPSSTFSGYVDRLHNGYQRNGGFGNLPSNE